MKFTPSFLLRVAPQVILLRSGRAFREGRKGEKKTRGLQKNWPLSHSAFPWTNSRLSRSFISGLHTDIRRLRHSQNAKHGDISAILCAHAHTHAYLLVCVAHAFVLSSLYLVPARLSSSAVAGQSIDTASTRTYTHISLSPSLPFAFISFIISFGQVLVSSPSLSKFFFSSPSLARCYSSFPALPMLFDEGIVGEVNYPHDWMTWTVHIAYPNRNH